MRFAIFLIAFAATADDGPVPKPDPTRLGIPFDRYTTEDSLGRTITFYLSAASNTAENAKLPVALFVQGSGCQSLFRKNQDAIVGGLQHILLKEGKDRVRVLVVEKPGVKFLDGASRPGSAEGASEEFLKEHTLSRWSEANEAALRAVWKLPEIDGSRTLTIGHSEGGIVVARVAAELPEVTHVASLAGGGPTQLFSLAEWQGQARTDDKPGDAAHRVQAVFEEWAKIQADPDSVTLFWLGHPYRRWSSFLQSSVAAELARSNARVYLAQGSLDSSVPATGHDVLVAELRARGRDVIAERIEGADHGFRMQDEPKGSVVGMQGVFGRVLDWFLTGD